MDEQQEIIDEFLVESNENLTQLDQDFVELEQRPEDADLLSSIFRTIHTIKGACGFLGFTILESITHRGESLLSQLRDGERELTPELGTLLLETFDVLRGILARIEATGSEGDNQYTNLCERLQAVCDGADAGAVAASTAEAGGEVAAAEDIASEEVAEQAAGEQETVQESAPETKEAGPAEGVPATEAGAAPAEDTPAPDAPVAEPPAAPAKDPLAAEAGAAPATKASATPETGEKRVGTEEHPAQRSSIADSNIRVSVELLDNLMNLVGELVLARNQILQHAESSASEDTGLVGASQRLNLITTELQANVMKTRMQPIRLVWNKLPRVVRDLGSSCGKRIELEMEGADTELDKTIIEAIKDPLTHIVRNSCDHGIETPDRRIAAGKPALGVLSLRAFHEGGQVNIEIADDGAGIDPAKIKAKAVEKGTLSAEQAERMTDREALNLIFAAGFSTAEKVTNVSGRGVGMDVVRTNIERIGGSIELQSTLGEGATIRIKIPLTLAIIPALVVSCSTERFAIPQVSLVELVRIEPGQAQAIESIHGAPVYRLRGKLLPLVYLDEVLGLERDTSGEGAVNIVVVQADERTFGLVVDGVQDTAEIVVKPLGKLLKGMSVYAGATIMGDGNVALILDMMGLARAGRVIGETRSDGQAATETAENEKGEQRQTMLLFRAGDSDRLAVPLALVDRLEEFQRERIEIAGGRPVVQYRDRILPLIELSERLGGKLVEDAEQPPAQVVVFSQGSQRVGVVVDEILDIVEDTVQARSGSKHPDILGSAVVGDRITDFIDLRKLIEQVDGDWFGDRSRITNAQRLLIVDRSNFSRGMLRQKLESAGYSVVEAANADEAVQRLSTSAIDIVLAALEGTENGSFPLLERMRASAGMEAIPVIGLAESNEQVGRVADRGPALADCKVRLDEDAVLESIRKLVGEVEAKAAAEPEPATV